MMNLKLFLNHRDNNPIFDKKKESGQVGLPCIVVGNGEQLVFDYNDLDLEDLKK